MSEKRKIGVSGGIGSGKTFVCKLIEKQGYPVYYSDYEAKRLMHDSANIRLALIERFGEEIYIGDELNREFLANIIFHNETERIFVNSVVHPVVQSDFHLWAEKQSSDLVFYESALLFDSKIYLSLDATILVLAPLELRIERIMKRDAISLEKVKARIESQGNSEEFRSLASFCIENDDSGTLDKQLNTILSELKNFKRQAD